MLQGSDHQQVQCFISTSGWRVRASADIAHSGGACSAQSLHKGQRLGADSRGNLCKWFLPANAVLVSTERCNVSTCNESAWDLGPRAAGLALKTSNHRNHQQHLLTWLHHCRTSQPGRKCCSETVKSSEDLSLSLLLWVTLWNKIFLFLELRKGKRQILTSFQGNGDVY